MIEKTKKTAAQGTYVYHNIFDELKELVRQGGWFAGERIPNIVHLVKENLADAGFIRFIK